MEFKRFKTEGIAHNAYILGTEGIGIIIDPRRDVDEYLEWALSKKINIKYVLQTHRQEDFVLGSFTWAIPAGDNETLCITFRMPVSQLI